MGTQTAGLLLAAGGGRRYGRPKALATADGQLWVDRALAVLAAAGCDPRVVVLGAAATEVRARARLDGAIIVENADWSLGMGSSLRAGLDALARTNSAATVVMLVDTPGVNEAAVRRVVAFAAFGRPDALVVATYGGHPGHPVLIGRDHWSGVATLARADIGARAYLREHSDRVREIPCDDVADGTDIDAPT